jgi:hypothetical protein
MSNRFSEHRVRTSLQAHIGRSTDPNVVDRLAAEVYHQDRGAYFTREQLDAMPWQSRELIESELANIHGPRAGGRR